MKRICGSISCMILALVLCGCAVLGYVPDKTAERTTPMPESTPVSFAVEEAITIAENGETEGAGQEPLPTVTPEVAAPAAEEIVAPWEPQRAWEDTGLTGVLWSADVPYSTDWQQEQLFLAADFDGDGKEESVFAGPIDTETDCLFFRVGEMTEETEIYCVLSVAVVRLCEGETPRLLVCGDFGSDDYMTYVFSIGTGIIVFEDMIEAGMMTEGRDLFFCERYECLGTRTGVRAYAGNPLMPVSETLVPSMIPTEEQLVSERETLIDSGILLKSKVDLTVKDETGAESVLPKGTYLYLVSFNETLDQIRVKTEEGALYVMETKLPNGGWVMTVNGLPEDMCFSNVSYAD